MILDSEFTEIRNWIIHHEGEIGKANYKTALDRAYYISFKSDFKTGWLGTAQVVGYRQGDDHAFLFPGGQASVS